MGWRWPRTMARGMISDIAAISSTGSTTCHAVAIVHHSFARGLVLHADTDLGSPAAV